MATEGIQLIIGDIVAKAEEQIRKIEEDNRAEVNKIVEDKGEEAEREKKKILERGENLAELEKQRILADGRIKAKKDQLDTKETIIKDVFDRAMERLTKITDSEDYKEVLFGLIKSSVETVGGKEVKLLVNKKDKKVLKENKDRLKKALRETKYDLGEMIDCIGGVIAKSKTIEVDNTLEARIERSMNLLRVDVAKILFG